MKRMSIEPAKTAYLIEGTLSLLIAAILVVLAAEGRPRDLSDPLNVRLGDMEFLLPLLPVMLGYAGVALTLAFVQRYSSWPVPVKLLIAAACGVGLSLYVFVHYFALRRLQLGGEVARWALIAVFAGGVLFGLSLAANALGVLRSRRNHELNGSPSAVPSDQMERATRLLKVYIVGGIALVVVPLALAWVAGGSSWLSGRGARVTELYAESVAYPTCLALGISAMVLGLLQARKPEPRPWQTILAFGYVVGAGIVSWGLYLAAERNWSGRVEPGVILGATLFAVALAANVTSIAFGRRRARQA